LILLGNAVKSSRVTRDKNSLVYLLGQQRGFGGGLDDEWLIIKFDSNGIFKEFKVTGD